jgi:cytochrome c biogenesis protein CcdA
MIELIAGLIPLLIIDVLNPVLFALLVVAVGTSRPIANSTALIAGHTAAYFFSGVVIALGLTKITDRLNNPLAIDFVIELIIGLLLLWAALASRDGKASETRTPEAELTPVFCFGYGAVVNFIGVPFALPYFAAVDQVLKANLSVESSVAVIALYNMAYAVPFLLVVVLVAMIGDKSKPILDKINNLLIGLVDRIMPLILFSLGLALAADALSFLISGEALWL